MDLLPLRPRNCHRKNITVQALSWCAEHFTEDITEETIAGALYVSPSYIPRFFSQKLRCSFREYINPLRVCKAQNLLENTNLRIVQITAQCGFRNQSNFNRVFWNAPVCLPASFATGCGSKPDYKGDV